MKTFEEMGLSPEIMKSITELGFVYPTPIQEKTLPVLLESNQDIVGLAQTGTGKTAAFGLPVLQKTDISDNRIQSLVICPTRELCLQIAKDMGNFSRFVKNFRVVAVYGGTSIETQIKALKKGCHMVVGTPGRMTDLIRRNVLKLSNVRYLVLDEADEMLNMGFKDDLDEILSTTPSEKQTLLFSATMPKEIQRIANSYMTDPVEITAGQKNAGAENVHHEFYVVNARNRYEVLKRIADLHPNIYGIVFCRTRNETKEVAEKFMQDGYNADALHGELSQAQRDHVMNRFRTRQLHMLVATDVAARGLDVNDLTHIINYNLPDDLEVYIHRSGRTGRAGKKGVSISIINTREPKRIRELEKLTGKRFERKLIPDGKEICEKQLFNLIDKMERVEVNEQQIEQFLPVIYKKLEWLSREELIKHFVSLEFNRFLAYYKNSSDLNVPDQKTPNDRSKSKNNRQQLSRFFISLGTSQGMEVHKLIGLINDQTQDRNIYIGDIDIKKNFSFFEVDSSYEDIILTSFKNARHDSNKITVELSKPATMLESKKKNTWNKSEWNHAPGKGKSKFDKKRKKY